MDPGTHMLCARFYPLEPGVTDSKHNTEKVVIELQSIFEVWFYFGTSHIQGSKRCLSAACSVSFKWFESDASNLN
jgi:hypothetical protein